MTSGKTVLVTGSTSGIGLGIARVFASENYNVVLNGRKSSDATDALCEELGQLGEGHIHFQACDMSKPDEIENMMADIDPIDVLINNAGMQHVSPVEDFPTEKWDLILALNLSSAFHTTRLALPHMKQQNWGRIINVSSVHGQVASSHKAAYVASKHGLIGFTKVCALETAETGITANALCPGWVRTPLVEEQIHLRAEKSGRSIEEESLALLSEKQPSKAFSTPKQLGETCLFLCSDAASQITGTSLTMDGGWTAV
ncbi:MAG: 3-hydroxybutyrate dehydrogenase [Methylocystaceae bacterium]|nr:3-hydroxybutyrate dehydrogenase [Methylocystaceae bacterium]